MPLSTDAYTALGNVCPDDERHALIVESDDWDHLISPGLLEFGEVFWRVFPIQPVVAFQAMRALFETVYTLGYRRGKAEHQMPAFVVAEEKAE